MIVAVVLAGIAVTITAQPATGHIDRGVTAGGVSPSDRAATADSLAVVTPTFSEAELNSPMMRLDKPIVEKRGFLKASIDSIVEWCFEHPFWSGLLINLVLGLAVWLGYRLCRYFFIERKP